MSFRFCVASLLAALLFTLAHADSFTHGGTVVIIAGLPGDMQSERAYSDQTQALLVQFQRAELTPKQVFLLTGSAAPAGNFGCPVTTLPNDRATFVGLADKLKGAAMPCTFIVFGHGGEQGSIPVFHVPGPRLMTGDFHDLAAAVPASNWLLFFCGSGEFAKALQADGRTILATESGEQVFTQDPISFGFFLTALERESDLDKIAAATGTATYSYYDSRSLARTEDPAIWVGTQAPRKLAVAESADNGTTKADLTTTLTSAMLGTPPPQPAAPGTPPPAPSHPASSDPAWAAITPVDASKYAGSDAVVLLRSVSYVIDDNDGVTGDEDNFLQILTPEGKRYGDIQLAFSPPDEDLNILACELRLPDGTVQQLDPDQIHDAAPRAQPGDYDTQRAKIFSFPQIEPGAIIRVHVQRMWRHFPFPHVFQEIPLVGENPVVAEKVQVGVPKSMAFHFKLLQQATVDPEISKTEYGSLYNWQFHDLPGALDEPLSPPEQKAKLVVTAFPDWTAFSDWYIGLIRESNKLTPELTQQAQTLAAGAKTDMEKIEKIARFVTNFRYVSVPLGVNSFRPHAAMHVWQNRYGDCKDKANLLCTLLTAVGFKPHLVLVPRFSQAYADLPGFAFNHAIATVDLGGKTLWIDTTDDVCRFGVLPPGDPGRNVLVVDDKVNSLTELPLPQAADHGITLTTKVQLPDASTRDAVVTISADSVGYGDYLLRASAEADGPHLTQPLMARAFTSANGTFTVLKQQSTSIDDLDSAFNWKAQGSWSGLVNRLPGSKTEMVRLPAWVPQEWQEACQPRLSPLHLNQGYPMKLVQTFDVSVPSGARAVKLPAAQSDLQSPLQWELQWISAGSGALQPKLTITLVKADLDVDETRAFQASCHHLLDALQDGLTYELP